MWNPTPGGWLSSSCRKLWPGTSRPSAVKGRNRASAIFTTRRSLDWIGFIFDLACISKLSPSDPLLLGIIMRERHDHRRQALLLAIELADLDRGARRCMMDIDPRQRDGAVEHRRAHARSHDPDLRPSDMNAVAVADRFIGGDL